MRVALPMLIRRGVTDVEAIRSRLIGFLTLDFRTDGPSR